METQLQNSTDTNAAGLVNGIIQDVQHLIKQQMELTRREIVEDIRKAKEAAAFYTLGAGVFFLGCVSLCFAIAHLLHWSMSPAGSDPASFPLWACHAVIGAVLAVIGGGLAGAGEMKWKSIDTIHNPATDALRKNVEWGLNRK
jgi:hypothetical protein